MPTFPLILSLLFIVYLRVFGHAVVAIGYTKHNSDVRLFCLDPAFDIAPTSFWNSIIDMSFFEPAKAIYSDKYFTPDGKKDTVTVDEILTIDEDIKLGK